jgi:hypothetical protein
MPGGVGAFNLNDVPSAHNNRAGLAQSQAAPRLLASAY